MSNQPRTQGTGLMSNLNLSIYRDRRRSVNERGGIFIFSDPTSLISFEIDCFYGV